MLQSGLSEISLSTCFETSYLATMQAGKPFEKHPKFLCILDYMFTKLFDIAKKLQETIKNIYTAAIN